MAETIAGVVASLTTACAAICYLRHRGASWRWFALGIASWGLALLVKISFSLAFADGFGHPIRDGLVMGSVSAASELGMAALFFRGRVLSLPNVLAFGAGIGAFEVLFVLLLAGLEAAADDAALVAPGTAALFFFLERTITLVGHVCSRVLVYSTLRTMRLLPAAVACAAFVLVDGVATYGDASGWNWEDTTVRGLFTAFITVVGVVELRIAWLSWLRVPQAAAPTD